MTQPAHHLACGGETGPLRQRRAVDHDNLHPKPARRCQFGVSPTTARVFGHDHVDPVILQQRKVIRLMKRTTGNDGRGIGQNLRPRRIDKAQQIPVLRGCGEQLQVLATDGQKDVRRRQRQGFDRILKALHMGPDVTGLRLPGRALQCHKGQTKGLAGLRRMMAHLRGKRVGGVDHMGDLVVGKVGDQPVNPAKTANPLGQGLCHRISRAPGIGKNSVNLRPGQGLGQQARLGCAAQQKDAVHG